MASDIAGKKVKRTDEASHGGYNSNANPNVRVVALFRFLGVRKSPPRPFKDPFCSLLVRNKGGLNRKVRNKWRTHCHLCSECYEGKKSHSGVSQEAYR